MTKATQGFGRLVYDKSPADLKDINEGRMQRMKVSPEVIRAFLNHPQFSPTVTTEIVTAMFLLNVENRQAFFERALVVDNPSAAFFMVRWAQMYEAYHARVSRLDRFVNLGRMPIAQRSDGVLIAVAPTDHLAWTQGVARQHAENMRNIHNISGVTGGEIWLAGSVSDLARRNLEAQQWIVQADKGRALGIR